jgi:hypothetical protein
MIPFQDSTDVVEDGAELSSRMETNGYLYVQNLLPAELLEELRLKFLKLARDGGWVKTDAPLDDAIADMNGFCVEPEPNYLEVYHEYYKLPEFHALQHHPALTGLLTRMAGVEIFPHPRLIARTIFPQREEFTTPPHQDFVPIQGTSDTYTAWFPLSDLPAKMGGLTICAGSHRHGVYNFQPALGAGGLEITDPLDGDWVSGEFKQGDVLFFHSLAVHQGRPNHSDRLRISVDARYQRVSDPVNPDSLEMHGKSITWQEVYADWPTNDLQYYWKKLDLTFKDFDASYFNKRDEMAIEMAQRGDLRAVSVLQRIAARNPDPEKQKLAVSLLENLNAEGD